MKRWDIYWANFPYEDDPTQHKRRPVVIANHQTVYVLTLKVTTHEPRADDPFDYPLRYWQESNLPCNSVVRVSKLAKLSPNAFGDYIGQIQPYDAMMITRHMRDYIASREKQSKAP